MNNLGYIGFHYYWNAFSYEKECASFKLSYFLVSSIEMFHLLSLVALAHLILQTLLCFLFNLSTLNYLLRQETCHLFITHSTTDLFTFFIFGSEWKTTLSNHKKIMEQNQASFPKVCYHTVLEPTNHIVRTHETIMNHKKAISINSDPANAHTFWWGPSYVWQTVLLCSYGPIFAITGLYYIFWN